MDFASARGKRKSKGLCKGSTLATKWVAAPRHQSETLSMMLPRETLDSPSSLVAVTDCSGRPWSKAPSNAANAKEAVNALPRVTTPQEKGQGTLQTLCQQQPTHLIPHLGG